MGQCSVSGGLSGVTAIAASQWHSLALKGDGTVVVWGCGGGTNFGQCTVPTAVCHATTIAAGNAHNLALAQFCQTIAFAPLASKTYRDADFSVSATASSGLPVSFGANGNCTVSAATVHLTGAGSCTVTASQSGSPDYNPAPDVSRSFAIAKAGQSITFVGPLENRRYGSADFIITASASSGLPVSFTASGRCTVRGDLVHLTGVGRCALTASQPGDANYNAAADVSWGLSALPMSCTVPRLVGRRIASARRAIASRHCRVGKVGHAYSGKRKKGIVISQSRRSGRVLPARSKINLIVSRGRRH